MPGKVGEELNDAVWNLLQQENLPRENYRNIQYLFRFLHEVSKLKEKNIYKEGTLRPGDRIIAANMKLPDLQALLYQEDEDTVFTVEYNIVKQVGDDDKE